MIYLGLLILAIGFGFIVTGIIGLFRFKDFYSKIHAAGVIESCGVQLSLFGLVLLQQNFVSSFKLVAIICSILLLNPVSTYAIARASIKSKMPYDEKIKQ